MADVSCDEKMSREINREIKGLIARGEARIHVRAPGARHNLGVGILVPVDLTFDGSVGYYCAGMIDGPRVTVQGSAGWGLAESMMDGRVVVHGSAGNGAGAAMRSGTVVIHGDAAARLGVSIKGGLILVAGNCGYMAGFMGQKGTLIVCGDAGPAFADSMYETVCYVGGSITELGNDAVVEEPSKADWAFLKSTLSDHFPEQAEIQTFKKVVSGRKLWNFDKEERAVWREAL
jgi:glutamate synthase domain-containing protein 3